MSEDPTRAQLMIDCARFFADQDLPAIRLASEFESQPANVLGCEVSVWEWLKETNANVNDAEAFGELIRRLHRLNGEPDFEIPVFDPLSKIRLRMERLRDSTEFPRDFLAVLQDALIAAESRETEMRESSLGTGILHGDALIGNAISTDFGMTLIDLDSVCIGPREWDVVPSLIAARRFGRGERFWQSFLRGYRIREEQLPELEAANIIKQLSMTVVLCFKHGESSAVNEEISRRINHWHYRDYTSRWCTPRST